jgi:transcriptional regulator with XRE-family HTH domain
MAATNDTTRASDERAPDALTFLRDLLRTDPGGATHLAQERLRVRLTDGLRQARFALGLSQRDLAQRLGTSQARVSHIESAGRDRRLDTLVAYTEALGADLLLALRVGDRIIEVSRPEGTRIALLHELTLDTFGGEPGTFERSSLDAPAPTDAPLYDAEPLMHELAA